jgi:glycogen phosphorylase
MEIGIDRRIPTYSGGLGILAGDMALSFADLGLPATFVSILSRQGYVSQKLDPAMGQTDGPEPWDHRKLLSPTEARATVEVGGVPQTVGAWEYTFPGKPENRVYFLDTDYSENERTFREATERLYGGGTQHRLLQDIILGVGGYRVLKALGVKVDVYHLNESHAALAIAELLRDSGGAEGARSRCAFTTHTPIAAGNDVFPTAMIEGALGRGSWVDWSAESADGMVDFSKFAAKYSGVTNAVSLKHRYVTMELLGLERITHVTNGVYHRRWVRDELKMLYDRHLPGWQDSPALLARATVIPQEELAQARRSVKKSLVAAVRELTGVRFEETALTITVAKRMTSYKRNNMILSDPERLSRVASENGEVQVIVAGKAHPRDEAAKAMLTDAIKKADQLNEGSRKVKVAILENYDIEMAGLLVAGSDVWLNNPRRPLEACGTSGIKAAMNGGLNLSVYDGWWLEAGVEGVNGWGIGIRPGWDGDGGGDDRTDTEDLYRKLEEQVVPTYYGDQRKWQEMSRLSVATVGPLFNSYRMVGAYLTRVYYPLLAGRGAAPTAQAQG